MVKVNSVEELLNELESPGVMGLEHNGEVQSINKQILLYSPITELLKNFHEGKLYTCPN